MYWFGFPLLIGRNNHRLVSSLTEETMFIHLIISMKSVVLKINLNYFAKSFFLMVIYGAIIINYM